MNTSELKTLQDLVLLSAKERPDKVYLREKAGQELAVLVEPLRNFFSAEEYHQKYLDKNPGGYCHIPRSFFSLGKE